jgi:hypothetical protein
MSYRNPKYTYQSHASYYQNLINAGVKAGSDIADQEKDIREEKQKVNAARVEAGRGANQTHVTTGVQSNTYGNEVTKGAIGNFFTGTGGLVGDLTMQTTGPDAPCNKTGNCAELNARLATLKKAPEEIKDFTERMLSQVNYDDYENFDENQGGNFILAANVLGGKGQFTPAYGYSYDIEENQVEGENGEMTYDGSYNWVFKFDENKARKQLEADCKKMPTQTGCDDIDGLINKMKFEGDNFKINSAGLKQQTSGNPPGSVFVRTPKMSNEMADIVSRSGFMKDVETDKNGDIIPGTGTFAIEDFMLVDDAGLSKWEQITEGTVGEGDAAMDLNIKYNLIDRNKIKNAMGTELNTKFNYYSEPQNQGQAIALWNKVLSKKDLSDINVEEVEKAIGFAPTEEDLKTWSYDNPNGLSERQLKLFEHLYGDYAVDEVYSLMTNEAYKSQRKYNKVITGSGDETDKNDPDRL